MPLTMKPARRRLILLLGLTLLITGASRAQEQPLDESALWRLIHNGEAVVLLRHALAPGIGDPSDFELGDCATQRNLSAAGRAQAKAIGERFRANGITAARVYSSQWCRCLETARLLGLGGVVPFPGLNSFFRHRSAAPQRTAAVRDLLQTQTRTGAPPLVLVTHQVNITALIDLFPDSGEMIIVRPAVVGSGADSAADATGALEVLGRIGSR